MRWAMEKRGRCEIESLQDNKKLIGLKWTVAIFSDTDSVTSWRMSESVSERKLLIERLSMRHSPEQKYHIS